MYLVTIGESITRILKTPLGSRVMRPEFGSELYTLRDRKFDEKFKALATKYIYEAINKNEPRVSITSIEFKIKPVGGVVIFVVNIENNLSVEVVND